VRRPLPGRLTERIKPRVRSKRKIIFTPLDATKLSHGINFNLLMLKLVKPHTKTICHAGLSGIFPSFSEGFPTSGNDGNETLQETTLVVNFEDV
jgi:hypothetical protein